MTTNYWMRMVELPKLYFLHSYCAPNFKLFFVQLNACPFLHEILMHALEYRFILFSVFCFLWSTRLNRCLFIIFVFLYSAIKYVLQSNGYKNFIFNILRLLIYANLSTLFDILSPNLDLKNNMCFKVNCSWIIFSSKEKHTANHTIMYKIPFTM